MRSHGRAFVDIVLLIILVQARVCEAIFARADEIWMNGCQRSDITRQDTGLKPVHHRFQERHTSNDDTELDLYGGEEDTAEIIKCLIARKKGLVQEHKAEDYDRNHPTHLSARPSCERAECTYKARDENARIAGILVCRCNCTS